MEEAHFLKDLVVVFGCAAPVVYIFHRLRQSPMIGFVITGALIGPQGFSLIRDSQNVHTMATVGVMILLFSLGLEFSLKKLMETRKAVLLSGPLQMLGTTISTVLIVRFYGVDLREGILYGILIGLSSTAVFMKMLAEHGEVDSVHGRIGLGIAIFQDLCTIAVMIAFPLMVERSGVLHAVGFGLGKAIMLMAAVVLVARYILPVFLRAIVHTHSKELFLTASVFIFLGTAWVTANAGVSLALGSFLAGLILSESEYGHHIFAEVRPFRDSLSSLFFISIGMLVDPGFMLSHAGTIAAITAAIMVGKTLITTGAVLAGRIPLQVATLTGIALAQVGEFSFILLQAGSGAGLINAQSYQIILACCVITMILTPALFGASRKWVSRLAARLDLRLEPPESSAQEATMKDHAIICGLGLAGVNIAKVLKANGIPYVIIDLNEQRVSEARKKGEPVLFGDCTSTHILQMAGIGASRVIIFVISDPFANRIAVKTAKGMNPNLVVLTRTKYVSDIDDLWDEGAHEVISEEFEVSLELITRVLRIYNTPRGMVAAEIKSIRGQRFGIFRERTSTVPRIKLSDDLEVYTETWQVPEGSPCSGRRISDTRLRGETGTLVLGIIRKNETLNNPGPEESILGGDRLVLSGTKEQLKKAIALLEDRSACSC